MGIRYYAYAFDADHAQQAVDDPYSILSSDPLADAWGMEPHATMSVATFEQVSPKRDMLYLDKAWRGLQALTCPTNDDAVVRPAYRMFEGEVTMHDGGWDSWVRTILPTDVPAIRDDLRTLAEPQVVARLGKGGRGTEDIHYILDNLKRAQEFVQSLASEGRGMVYPIG